MTPGMLPRACRPAYISLATNFVQSVCLEVLVESNASLYVSCQKQMSTLLGVTVVTSQWEPPHPEADWGCYPNTIARLHTVDVCRDPTS